MLRSCHLNFLFVIESAFLRRISDVAVKQAPVQSTEYAKRNIK